MRKAVMALCLLAAGCSGAGDQTTGTDTASTGPLADPPMGEATAATAAANAAVAERLPLEASSDFEDATRGLLARIEAEAITDSDGNVVWDIAAMSFLEGDAPDTVNPSLFSRIAHGCRSLA